MPLITYNYKSLYFIHIPKTGGSSIYDNLQKAGATIEYLNETGDTKDDINPQHLAYKRLENEIENFDKLTKFSIFRRPSDRTISEYFWKTDNTNLDNFPSWLNETLDRYDNGPHWADNHLLPQINFISKDVIVYPYDYYQDCINWLRYYFEDNFDASLVRKAGPVAFSCKPPISKIINSKLLKRWTNVYKQDIEYYSKLIKNR